MPDSPKSQQNERPKSPPQGDERTPDKTQGQIKYASGHKKSEGGAGEPKVSGLTLSPRTKAGLVGHDGTAKGKPK